MQGGRDRELCLVVYLQCFICIYFLEEISPYRQAGVGALTSSSGVKAQEVVFATYPGAGQ